MLRLQSLDCELWRPLDCGRLPCCGVRSESTWRVSSSIRSSRPDVVSGVERETLAVVGSGVTSQIRSAWWEAESRLPSVWPASMTCKCSGRQLAQMARRKSFGTSGARALRYRRNCDGFRSPISSCERSCLTCCSREVYNRHTSSALSRS